MIISAALHLDKKSMQNLSSLFSKSILLCKILMFLLLNVLSKLLDGKMEQELLYCSCHLVSDHSKFHLYNKGVHKETIERAMTCQVCACSHYCVLLKRCKYLEACHSMQIKIFLCWRGEKSSCCKILIKLVQSFQVIWCVTFLV